MDDLSKWPHFQLASMASWNLSKKMAQFNPLGLRHGTFGMVIDGFSVTAAAIVPEPIT
jgi:hypothetical protein